MIPDRPKRACHKKKVKVNVTIAIGLSFVITAISLYMIPQTFGIVEMMPSQLSTTIVFLLNGLIWYVVQKTLSGSLLAADRDKPFEEIQKAYNVVMHDEGKKKEKTFLLIGAMFAVTGAILTFVANPMMGLPIIVFGIIVGTQPKRMYKSYRKKLRKEVEKALFLTFQKEYRDNQTRIKIPGDELAAEESPNSQHPGICVYLELENGDIMDIVLMEHHKEDGKSSIEVYDYEDVWSEDWTRKHSIDMSEVKKAFEL